MDDVVPLHTRPGEQRKPVKKVIQTANARERERQALELRKAGVTYSVIADRLGYKSHQGAHAAVKRALDRIADEPADDLKKIHQERLNTMLMVLWPQVQAGDERAIGQAVRIMDRQAALHGLEAPTRLEVSGGTTTRHVLEIGGSKEEFIASLQAHRKALAAETGGDRITGAPWPGSDDEIIEAELVEE